MTLRALFGEPLEGSKPVRFIYIDEAGTSFVEQVSVVVGVIVHADAQWMPAAARLNKLFDAYVPEKLRPNFTFHAKTLVGAHESEKRMWKGDNLWKLIDGVLSIPMQMGLPVSVGTTLRSWRPKPFKIPKEIKLEQLHHFNAMHHCLASADEYLRTYTEEVAYVVAEDVPKTKKLLERVSDFGRLRTFSIPRNTPGSLTDRTELKITKIVGSIHFANRRNEPLLQIADACAYSVRRYLHAQPHGERLIEVMCGSCFDREPWLANPQSGTTMAWSS